MRVDVLLFAQLKDELGPSVSIEVAEPATVASVRAVLAAAHPAVARFGPRAKAAINETWAKESDAVRPGDTVALLPPVAGG